MHSRFLCACLLLHLPLIFGGCNKPANIAEVKEAPVVAVATPEPSPRVLINGEKAPTATPAPVIPAATPTPEPDKPTAPEVTKEEPVVERQPTVIVVPPVQEAPAEVLKAADVEKPLVALPEPPQILTPAGRALIYQFEVGGGQPYYNRFLARPTWPGAASGVTIAIGYDLGYNSRAVILSDWKGLPGNHPARLAEVAGYKGGSAKPKVAQVRDILVAWKIAEEVYDRVTVTKFYSLCKRTYPGFEELRPNAQAAILSLTFNRGNSLVGERRREMKEIARLAPKADYAGMAKQIRLMKRVWTGTDIQAGMYRRRDAEARLMETP